MKKRQLFSMLIGALILGGLAISCSGDDDPDPITGEALFSYKSNGMEVTFTNLSTVSGTVTYSWDFGDDETSAEENPIHTYATKGEYTVMLTVTDEQGGDHVISTKVAVDKATRISLDDDTFDDWDAVTEEKYIMSTGGELSGIVTAAKVDYDAENVYVYIEFEGTLEYGFFFDFFFDNDNDTLTGNRGWIWPDMGADYLIEGQFTLLEALPAMASFYFNGETQDAWAWGDDKPFSAGYFAVGHSANMGSAAAVEISFDRSKVTDLDNEVVQIGVFLSDPSTWADVGYAPDKAEEEGRAAGWTIDMR
jgi:PKD repeat protein